MRRIVVRHFLLALAVTLTGLGTFAKAQTVSVLNGLGERGFGWMFAHEGVCYVVLPRHVAGPLPRINIASAGPVARGSATAISPFWDGIDLSLAVARGAIEERCTETLEILNVSERDASNAKAQLLRQTPNGEEDRTTLSILDRDYLRFFAQVTEQESDIAQGTSGAFAFVGNVPIGMAITSDDPSRAAFMRSEEIYMNVARYLSQQAAVFARVDTGPEVLEKDSIPVTLHDFTVEPLTADFGAENLLGHGVHVFRPQPLMQYVFKIVGDGSQISEIQLRAPKVSDYAQPKDILLEWSADETGKRFRVWHRGVMAPDGLYATGTLAPRKARWLRLTLRTLRGDGPAAIEQISVR